MKNHVEGFEKYALELEKKRVGKNLKIEPWIDTN